MHDFEILNTYCGGLVKNKGKRNSLEVRNCEDELGYLHQFRGYYFQISGVPDGINDRACGSLDYRDSDIFRLINTIYNKDLTHSIFDDSTFFDFLLSHALLALYKFNEELADCIARNLSECKCFEQLPQQCKDFLTVAVCHMPGATILNIENYPGYDLQSYKDIISKYCSDY